MIQFRIHGSGGQGVVVAAELFAAAAAKSGYMSQSFSSYGAERRGGKVEGYVRISEETIFLHCKMYDPDYIILMEESFVRDPIVLSGLKENGGLLINSFRPPESFSSLKNFKIVTIDAISIARYKGLMLPNGTPIINTVILGAIVGMFPMIKFDCLSEALREGRVPHPEKNIEAAREAYYKVKLQVKGAQVEEVREVPEIPIARYPMYMSKAPPCEGNCPAGESIQTTVSLIQSNQFEDALSSIKAENPFPGICGRVCFHPCENHCNRNEYDEGIAINSLEKAVFDYANGKTTEKQKKRAKTGKKVAIIGSGPSGMSCAYFLAILGHDVTVFEALPVLGGIPRVGIPPYRLPRDIVEREIREIISLGIPVKTNMEIGKDISFNSIVGEYDASFIATGAHKSAKLNIQGEDCDGVIFGLEFLKGISLSKEVEIGLGAKVAVIGGGNTAVDAARTAKRLGAQDVLIIYRRSIKEMPAYRQEVVAAEREGIKILPLSIPIRIHHNRKRVIRLECLKTELGEKGEDGRLRPEPVVGSNFIVDVDTVIVAVGESPKVPFLPDTIEMNGSLVKVDQLGQTSMRGVFAGGDATSLSRSVVEAIASGKRAALGIDIWLTDADEKSTVAFQKGEHGAISMAKYLACDYTLADKDVVRFTELNTAYFTKSARTQVTELPPEIRSSNFSEVASGLSKTEAMEEAERCFNCGHCNSCENCYIFCPEIAIRFDMEKSSFVIESNLCKRCGICIEECPRNALIWER